MTTQSTTPRPGHVKGGSLRGGNFSGRAALAYRVEKSSGPETLECS